jgi:hypothetical protein
MIREVIRIASLQTAFSFIRVIRAIRGQKLLNSSGKGNSDLRLYGFYSAVIEHRRNAICFTKKTNSTQAMTG